jgi:hypothetical protein
MSWPDSIAGPASPWTALALAGPTNAIYSAINNDERPDLNPDTLGTWFKERRIRGGEIGTLRW